MGLVGRVGSGRARLAAIEKPGQKGAEHPRHRRHPGGELHRRKLRRRQGLNRDVARLENDFAQRETVAMRCESALSSLMTTATFSGDLPWITGAATARRPYSSAGIPVELISRRTADSIEAISSSLISRKCSRLL